MYVSSSRPSWSCVYSHIGVCVFFAHGSGYTGGAGARLSHRILFEFPSMFDVAIELVWHRKSWSIHKYS